MKTYLVSNFEQTDILSSLLKCCLHFKKKMMKCLSFFGAKLMSEFLANILSRTDVRGLSQKVVDFYYNTRLCIRNSMKFVRYFYMHHMNILHKYGWNHILDINVMSLYLTVCRRVRSTSKVL